MSRIHIAGAVKLNYLFLKDKKFTTSDNLLVLHGLYGSVNNFKGIVKNHKIASIVSTYLVDLRNHGLSEFSNSMSL